jgi:hypothetical protein
MKKFYLRYIIVPIFFLLPFSSCSEKQTTSKEALSLKQPEKITLAFTYTDSLIASIVDTISDAPKFPNYLILSKGTCMNCAEEILDACTNADKELCVLILGATFEEIIKNNVIHSRRSKLRFIYTHPALYDTLESHDKRMAYNLLYAIKRTREGKILTYNNMQNFNNHSGLKPDSVTKFLLTESYAGSTPWIQSTTSHLQPVK